MNPGLRRHGSLGKTIEPLSSVTLSLCFHFSITDFLAQPEENSSLAGGTQEDKPVPPGSPLIFRLFPGQAVGFPAPRHVERREVVAAAAWAGCVYLEEGAGQ